MLTAVLILFTAGPRYARAVALAGSVLQLIASVVLLVLFVDERNRDSSAFLFQSDVVWFEAWNIHYHIGVDGISVAMILLTAFIVLAGVLVSWNVERLSREFFFLLVILSAGAYGFFISLDLFTLFFFLELAVIPKFLLIGIWGSGKKEYSAMKLGLMLMAGSALVFVSIAGLYSLAGQSGSFNLVEIGSIDIAIETQRKFFPFAFAGFGIFAALFPFHTWVPDGHSSAPTAASMFLAGISMKLGGYGCLRVATYLMPEAAREYSTIIIVLACIAILYGAFATMMQTDLKYINAYSSVSHCGFVLLGIGMLTKTAIVGAVLQMVSHGLMTALFFAAIGMLYERTHTRKVSELGGMMKMLPFISTLFFIAGLCSLGLPGLSGFVAEVTVFMGSWENDGRFYKIATIIACASIVVTAVYILRAVAGSMMGELRLQKFGILPDAKWNERIAALLLVAGIIFIGILPFYLTDLIEDGTNLIINKFTVIK